MPENLLREACRQKSLPDIEVGVVGWLSGHRLPCWWPNNSPAAAQDTGIECVKMEAAGLYAYANARNRDVVWLDHISEETHPLNAELFRCLWSRPCRRGGRSPRSPWRTLSLHRFTAWSEVEQLLARQSDVAGLAIKVDLYRRCALHAQDAAEAVGVMRNPSARLEDDVGLLGRGLEGTGFKVAPLGPSVSHDVSIILPLG